MSKKGNLAKERAKNFGVWLDEASSYMLDFTTSEDFEQINPDIQMKLNRVSESLLDFWSMWHDGQQRKDKVDAIIIR